MRRPECAPPHARAPREGGPIAAQDPLIGTTLAGRYRITARLGAGAMGAVYRAEQLELGRTVALKVVHTEPGDRKQVAARFAREARAMSALTHLNTVRVYDFGETDDGLLFLAMELLEGELAGDWLALGGRPAPETALRWVRQALASLVEAHDKGIIHRDIKPDNLFLAHPRGAPVEGPETRVKVLDFGIAKAITGELHVDQFETQDGTVFGTPRYMSPEQCQGKTLDARSDLYAVGIVLHELLFGRPPFVDKDAVVVMAKHIREKVPIPEQAHDGSVLSPRLRATLATTLAKTPDARFQDARQLDAALADCIEEGAALASIAPTPLGRARRWLVSSSPRLRWAAAGAVAALLLLLWLAAGDEGGATTATPTPAPEPAAGDATATAAATPDSSPGAPAAENARPSQPTDDADAPEQLPADVDTPAGKRKVAARKRGSPYKKF